MPAALPKRFRPEVRLGRDGDTEAWLATDTALDRPVLVRSLGPETNPQRRQRFVEAVRNVAGVGHVHLAAVYAVGASDQGAYAVTEWAGGVTIGDRLRAGETIPVEDFLPNAAGLADALAAVHAHGLTHGALGPDTILFSAAHPAKLAEFGRKGNGTPKEDTTALAETLAMGLAGGPVELPLSQVVEGLPAAVDTALTRARRGSLDAAGLAAALRAAPSIKSRPRSPAWTWRWVIPAALLLAAALGVVALGFALEVRSDSLFLFPARPVAPPSTAAAPTTGEAPPTTSPGGTPSVPLTISETDTYDPFGDGTERDGDSVLASDGDVESAWRTERYFDPLRLLKPGVGLTFSVEGSPRFVEVVGSNDLRFEILWAEQRPEDFSGWRSLGAAAISGGRSRFELPTGLEGVWLLWLTDLPAQENGEFFFGFVNEVRFLS